MEECVESIKQILLKRLCGFENFRLLGLDLGPTTYMEDAHEEIFQLLSRTVKTGESNSVLLIGQRGSGKTALIKQVLEDMNEGNLLSDMLVVHLNGLMQTDDQIAIEEMTRQLQLNNVIGEKIFGSFADKFRFLLESLKSGSSKSKCVTFILEEFDLFCKLRNQHLLYNLFDVSQSCQTPVAVVGITCSLDAVELLEKRVKSRFSHRQIHIYPEIKFENYVQAVKQFLSLPNPCEELGSRYAKDWNCRVERVVDESKVKGTLQRLHDVSADFETLKSLLMLIVSGLGPSRDFLTAVDFSRAESIVLSDSKCNLLLGLSVLELCLLFAMKKLRDNYDSEAFNFQMVYREYCKLPSQRGTVLTTDRGTVFEAFKNLRSLELIRHADRSGVPEEFLLVSMDVEDTLLKKTLTKYPQLPTEIVQWARQSSF